MVCGSDVKHWAPHTKYFRTSQIFFFVYIVNVGEWSAPSVVHAFCVEYSVKDQILVQTLLSVWYLIPPTHPLHCFIKQVGKNFVGTSQFSQKQPSCMPQHKW